MQQAILTNKTQLTRHDSYANRILVSTGLFTRFTAWCDIQERNRFLWLAIALVGGIATILPLTLIAIVFGANNDFNLWIITCAVNVPILVVNLAVQPTKLILPVLFSAWVIDAIIIIYSLIHLLMK